jgi:hypothetical protein
MNLYQPLFTSRSAVAVPGGQVATPRQYESAVRQGVNASAGMAMDASKNAALPLMGNDPLALITTLPGYRANPLGHEYDTVGGLRMYEMNALRDGASVTDSFSPGQAARFQGAEATSIQDFFEYRFPFPVQLASRQSALLPFLQNTMPTERVSIYNPAADRGNPRLGVRVENNTGIPFEPGPITFFEEGRYAGEAVLAYLPRSEKRLVSYGVDYDIQIAGKAQSQPETTVRISAAKGIVVFFKESLLTTTYEIRNKGTAPKTLIIEHPRSSNRKLQGMEPWETTDSYHRFKINLAPGEMTEVAPSEVVSRATQVSVSQMNRQQFVELFSGKDTPQALRAKLGEIVDVQERIATLNTERAEIEKRSTTLYRDQERLRENLKALRDTREDQNLRSRYLGQLSKQEDDITAIQVRADELSKEIKSTQSRLGELIEKLSWG